MALRPTQSTIFRLVHSGISLNLAKLARAQEQIATGKRITRPSDDPVGAARAMALRRQAGGVGAYLSAAASARPVLSAGASRLQEASAILSDARAEILAGLNGTLGESDREALAVELELMLEALLEAANAREGERFLFSGTSTSEQPFVLVGEGAERRVVYEGDEGRRSALVGRGVDVALNLPGSEVFARLERTGVQFQGSTGVAGGSSADSGTGYHELRFRHDATTGTLGAGIALANGGADDTILGDHALVVDAAARTVRLGGGDAVAIPDPPPAVLEVADADGSVVVLDFTGWTGADEATVLTGAGSVALNDGPYQAIDLTETDLELVDEARGVVLHVDTTGVTRAADELVTFAGAANAFDALLGAIADLRNAEGRPVGEVFDRLELRLGELDRNRENVLVGLSTLGARQARVESTEARLRDQQVHVQALLSNVEDADFAEVALELSRAEQTLQVAQATGARLMQQSLLSFLR